MGYKNFKIFNPFGVKYSLSFKNDDVGRLRWVKIIREDEAEETKRHRSIFNN